MSDTINPLDNPAGANATIASVLAPATVAGPVIENFHDDQVLLPGGVIRSNGQILRHAQVRELTGEHEEAIARSRMSGNVSRVVSTLLECGTVQIDGVTADKTLLDSLLTGDRDALILGIRIATYGPTIEFEGVRCPHCSEVFDIDVNLSELERHDLTDPIHDRVFHVPLRRGRVALVRLPTGADQAEAIDPAGLSVPQRSTIMLSKVVLSIIEADGTDNPVRGDGHIVQALAIPDRTSILDALNKREPGPRYRDVSFEHNTCGKEVQFPLEVGDLFREL